MSSIVAVARKVISPERNSYASFRRPLALRQTCDPSTSHKRQVMLCVCVCVCVCVYVCVSVRECMYVCVSVLPHQQ